MPLDDTALNAMADHLSTLATKAALHSADPGTGATNETSAARQDIAWTSAANGDTSISGTEQFTGGAANGACTWVTIWNTAGTVRYGKFPLTGDLTFNAAGEYDLTALTLNGSSA
jgi:hypothetical protein